MIPPGNGIQDQAGQQSGVYLQRAGRLCACGYKIGEGRPGRCEDGIRYPDRILVAEVSGGTAQGAVCK